MLKIQLTKNKVALVHEAFYAYLAPLKWHTAFDGWNYYAIRNDYALKYTRPLKMHRVVAGAGYGEKVDHRDGDGLNNQPHNLRICTRENTWNRRRACNNTSGFKGVHFDPNRGTRPWRARITINEKRECLGRYATAEQAARAYDVAARHYFGAFARCNFTDEEKKE